MPWTSNANIQRVNYPALYVHGWHTMHSRSLCLSPYMVAPISAPSPWAMGTTGPYNKSQHYNIHLLHCFQCWEDITATCHCHKCLSPQRGLQSVYNTDNTSFTGGTSHRHLLSVNEWPAPWKRGYNEIQAVTFVTPNVCRVDLVEMSGKNDSIGFLSPKNGLDGCVCTCPAPKANTMKGLRGGWWPW